MSDQSSDTVSETAAVELSESERRALRGRAHALKPVVMIGQAGLSAAVLAEIERALDDHELIKIKARVGDRKVRNALFETACANLGAVLIQRIGNVAVLYRPGADADT